ncbi:MAG: ribosome small subunit-dependent GTPase A [Bacteroidales bacterium]|jgi:ribosome biogenesis GTPase|nr:ribosome small subunit-dependent GTPase A [Bacteroidales bacterium]
MNLADLGITNELFTYLTENELSNFSIGRVTQEHRERYVVSDGDNEYEAEITGNLRFSANSRADFPAVGDWVTLTIFDSDQAIIHKILPRRSILERQAVGKFGEIQIISTNIDVAFIIQAINNNFNINRLERYMTICYSANIEPVLVISKIDLSTEKEIRDAIIDLEKRDKKIKYILLSNTTLKGLDQILDFIQAGKTYCVVGSSGVGKSTLINNLLKKNILKTGQISHSTNKGRHVTDHRELFVLENGGIIIDTPGMKELGMTDNSEGTKTTFQEISDISLNCKFPDCKHLNETGCAVIEALNNGIIDKDSYDNYQKIHKEQVRFQTTVAEKRKKEKVFGKMIKNYYKDKKY